MVRRQFLFLTLASLAPSGVCFAAMNTDSMGRESNGKIVLSIAETEGESEIAAFQSESGAAPAAPIDPDVAMSELKPPATEDEIAMYKNLKSKSPAELGPFIATRKYFRQLKAQFPDGNVDWKKAPKPPEGMKSDYLVDFDEQLTYLAFGMNSK